jgi:IS5 family transposase
VDAAGSTVCELASKPRLTRWGRWRKVSEVGVERVVPDKGYHSLETLQELAEVGVRTVIAETGAGTAKLAQAAGNGRRRRRSTPTGVRLQTRTGKALMRRRGELMERSFAHLYDTGGVGEWAETLER